MLGSEGVLETDGGFGVAGRYEVTPVGVVGDGARADVWPVCMSTPFPLSAGADTLNSLKPDVDVGSSVSRDSIAERSNGPLECRGSCSGSEGGDGELAGLSDSPVPGPFESSDCRIAYGFAQGSGEDRRGLENGSSNGFDDDKRSSKSAMFFSERTLKGLNIATRQVRKRARVGSEVWRVRDACVPADSNLAVHDSEINPSGVCKS
jgi:hypothetical protein